MTLHTSKTAFGVVFAAGVMAAMAAAGAEQKKPRLLNQCLQVIGNAAPIEVVTGATVTVNGLGLVGETGNLGEVCFRVAATVASMTVTVEADGWQTTMDTFALDGRAHPKPRAFTMFLEPAGSGETALSARQ